MDRDKGEKNQKQAQRERKICERSTEIYISVFSSHLFLFFFWGHFFQHPSFLIVLVSSCFHFYICPFLVIFLSAPLIDSFFFFHLLFSPLIFFQPCFRHFLRSVFPINAVILNVVPLLIFPTFFFSSLPVAFFENDSKKDCLKYEATGYNSRP